MPKSYLIQNATLISPGHSNHLKKTDILIIDGTISEIGSGLKGDQVIEGNDLYVSAGWIDLRTHLNDPGEEYKDSVKTLLETAARGGFTSICTLPDSTPSIHDKSGVEYLLKRAEGNVVDLYPTGMLSDHENKENLSELYDMHRSGAVAFTNGDRSMSNGVLKKAMLYNKPFGAPVFSQPIDHSLHNNGMVNESEETIHTGLKSSPALAEYSAVLQQLEIARYCDAPIHFSAISTKESVDLIRKAKAEGVAVTCDVSIFNLSFTDKEVLGFDENFKLYPPLRSDDDRKALIAGVNDGTIDAICSNHQPQDNEGKTVEFDYAEYGALSMQMVWPWYNEYLKNDIELETFVEKLTSGPASIIRITPAEVKTGAKAILTVFDNGTWTFNNETNGSLSKNTHVWGEQLTGRVRAVINNEQIKIINQ